MSEKKEYKNLVNFQHYNQAKGTATNLTITGDVERGTVFLRLSQKQKSGEVAKIIIALNDMEVSELTFALMTYILKRKEKEL